MNTGTRRLATLKYRVFPFVALVLLALWLRLHLLGQHDFDGLYGQDAFAYTAYGEDIYHAISELRWPGPTYWPLGLPALLAAGYALFGESAKTGQLLVLVMGALIPGLAYLFTLESLQGVGWLKDEARLAGGMVGLVLTFSGQLLRSSLVVMADGPALAWALLGAWALMCYGRLSSAPPRVRYRWVALAALALAWATITRWVYGVLGLAWGAYCMSLWGRNLRSFWRDGIAAGLAAGPVLLPQLIHSAHTPKSFIGHAWLQSWSPANAFKADFVNPDGVFHYAQPNAVYYLQIVYQGWYLHAIFGGLAAVGSGYLIAQGQRGRPLLALLWLWFAVPCLFLVGIPYQNIRFALVFVAPLTILAGIGVVAVLRLVKSFGSVPVLRSLRTALQGYILLALLCAAQSPYVLAQEDLAQLVTTKNKDLTAIQRAQAMVEPNAVVYTLELWSMMDYYSPLATRQLFYENPETIADRLPANHPAYLLVNVWSIEHQWIGQPPWLSYYALKTYPGLDHLARFGNYHLFLIHFHSRTSEADGWFINLRR